MLGDGTKAGRLLKIGTPFSDWWLSISSSYLIERFHLIYILRRRDIARRWLKGEFNESPKMKILQKQNI